MKHIIVAIDGPAGAGKSSIAKAVAQKLGLALVDTGAIYRCVALAAQRADIEWTDDEALARLLPWLDIAFRFEDGVNHVTMRGEDVTEAIRTPEISKGASVVSARPIVRAGLLDLQRKLARGAGVGAVLEGRDIGTVVFPEAPIKLFVTASEQVRAERRQKELEAKGVSMPIAKVLEDQAKRDRDDMTRDVAPMRPASDAVMLDTSAMSLEAVVDEVVTRIEKARQM